MSTKLSEGRRVRLLLVTNTEVVGMLPPYWVPTPWWSEVASVVEGARAVHSVDVTVLRLLKGRSADPQRPALGGDTVYVAQLEGPRPAGVRRWDGTLCDNSLRAPWARPGGPETDLAWAEEALVSRGRALWGRPVQSRTWHLSSIWRIPTMAGDAWLKVVPPFLAPEGAVLESLQAHPVPRVIAFDTQGRALLEHVAGENGYRAAPERLVAMVGLLVDMQAAWRDRAGELVALGAPDLRRDSFVRAAEEVVTNASASVSVGVRHRLDDLVDGLHRRFADLESCGVPDTVVHGDAHPGNFRGEAGSPLVLLDWADCGVGHPLLDVPAFLEVVPSAYRDMLERRWTDEWSWRVPGSDARRALTLVQPLGALHRAGVYLRFLRSIEPSERCYHRQDVPHWLKRAVLAYP